MQGRPPHEDNVNGGLAHRHPRIQMRGEATVYSRSPRSFRRALRATPPDLGKPLPTQGASTKQFRFGSGPSRKVRARRRIAVEEEKPHGNDGPAGILARPRIRCLRQSGHHTKEFQWRRSS